MLYLHLGWPRTSTSSLQAALLANRRRLEDLGVSYPERWMSPREPTHHYLRGLIDGGAERSGDRDDFKRFIAARSDMNVLFSAEILTGMLLTDGKREALMGFLAEIGQITPVRCIWTLRRLDHVVNSYRLLLLKARAYRDASGQAGYAQFLPAEASAELGRWERLFAGMAALDRAFEGTVSYVKYHPAGNHQRDLLAALGLQGEAVRLVSETLLGGARLNRSPSQKLVTALIDLKTLSSKLKLDLDSRVLVRAFDQGRLTFDVDRPFDTLGPAVAGEIRKRALEAARRFGVGPYVEFFGAELSERMCPKPDFVSVTDADLKRMAAVQVSEPVAPIVQYWDSRRIPDDIAELIATFRRHNPRTPHLTFDEVTAKSFIEEHFSSRETSALSACALPVMQADYFRYCAILALGGIYADTDFRCIASTESLVKDVGGGEIFLRRELNARNADRQAMRLVMNSFFIFPSPRHPFLRLALELATACIEERVAERFWASGEEARRPVIFTTGPGIFTAIRALYELGSFDALLKAVAGGPGEPFSRLYCEVVDDHERVVEAFEGVRVSTRQKLAQWIADPCRPLQHKRSDAYWMRAKMPILR